MYRLADYLDQYGRHQRKGQFPPAGFWAAAADHALPGDQATLGDAARARGLYRDAAQLFKSTAAHGDPRAGADLITLLHDFHPGDHRPAQWVLADRAAKRIPLDLGDPVGVVFLLDSLWKAGAQEQVTALLGRDPANRVAVDNPHGVAELLGRLWAAGAQKQVTALADRAAKRIPLDDLIGVVFLLGRLREAGAQEQAAALADRAANQIPLDDPLGVDFLLDGLRRAGAQEQVTVLLGRDPASLVALETVRRWRLVGRLREAGAQEQAAALADRAANHIPLDDPVGVAVLLEQAVGGGRAGAGRRAAGP